MKTINIQNRKARFNFELFDKYYAGLQLGGTEIKSIRNGKASIAESFCEVKNNEVWCINMTIEEYAYGTHYNHKPKRERKLLLQKKEIKKISRELQTKGLTLVPLRIFLNDRGLAKIEIAIAKGKKLYDKRDTIKKNDLKREFDRKIRVK